MNRWPEAGEMELEMKIRRREMTEDGGKLILVCNRQVRFYEIDFAPPASSSFFFSLSK